MTTMWISTRRLACALGLVMAGPSTAAEPWTLERVLAEAAAMQPDSVALQALSRGAALDAAAARSLPPPMWRAGVANLPVTGGEAFDLNADDMTMRMFGIEQAWPSRALREANAGMREAQARMWEAEAAMQSRMRQERAGMAWIEAWIATRRIDLHEAQIELLQQAEAAAVAAAAEGADVADALEWQAMRAMHELEHAREQQDLAQARADLGALLGVTIEDFAAELPQWPLPDAALLRRSLGQLPELGRVDAEAAEAQSELAMRKAESRPQWEWMLSYGERMPGMSDMASLEVRVSFDALFGTRQSQLEAAALARIDAAEARHAAQERRFLGEIEAALAAYANARAAMQVIEQRLRPLREQQLALAEARYAQGSGELMPVFEARRQRQELELERLMTLEAEWRARLQLRRLDASHHQGATP